MNKREKLLWLIVGSLALLLVGFIVIKILFLKPLQEIDRQTTLLREKLRLIHEEGRAFFSSEDYIKRTAQTTFGGNADVATARAGKMVTDLILRVGLPESEFARTPVGPRKMRGAQEVGWNIHGEGPLPKIIDLLFELEQCPQLHRLEGVVISAAEKPSRVKARFQFLTLVIDSAPEVARLDLKPKFTLADPERRAYDIIARRDLLRPYLKRSGPDRALAATDGDPLAAGRPELLKVVSLSDWQGAPEVHIMNLASMKLLRFKPGDELSGGQIVMVDYRARPMPGKPGLASYSRMILKIGADYWAVEHGQTLADKYKLGADALPSGLPKM